MNTDSCPHSSVFVRVLSRTLGGTAVFHHSIRRRWSGVGGRKRPFGSYRTAPTQTITDRDFTGQRENRELGLLYYNARFYHPGIGRFISPDTLVPSPTNPQMLNRFAYTLNNPVKHTDPSGHCVFGLPCPQSVENGLVAVNDFLLGAEAEWIYNNSLGLAKNLEAAPGESAAMTAGRVAGDIATVVQGVQEAVSGAGTMAGGAAVCLTGVGCLATPVVELIGAAAAAHGVAVAAHGVAGLVENGGVVLSTAKSSGSGNIDSRNFTRLSKGEVKLLEKAGYHPHDLKPSKQGSKYDIFKDEYGDLHVMPKDGSGPGDPLGININDLWDKQ